MQGRSDDRRELLDVEAVAGHLLKPGSVFAFLAEHRLLPHCPETARILTSRVSITTVKRWQAVRPESVRSGWGGSSGAEGRSLG